MDVSVNSIDVDGSARRPGNLPTPVATRLRRPGWRDPRLLTGVVLVAGSVALGSWLVAGAGRTVPVYAASAALVPGQEIDVDSLVVRQVRLDGAADAYLSARTAPPEGLVAVRTVGPGELVPTSAVSTARDLDVRPIAVASAIALPSGVVAGSAVDLWFVPVPPDDAAPALTPYPLAEGLVVAEVSEAGGAFAVGSAPTVQVLVPVDQLPDVLAALASEGTVEVVLVPGGVSP